MDHRLKGLIKNILERINNKNTQQTHLPRFCWIRLKIDQILPGLLMQ